MTTKSEAAKTHEKRFTVLVVDDEQDIRDGSERILTRTGCHVFTANRGQKGLDILKKEKISLVLLDLKMPGMDGMEVLQKIREMDESVLVIIITGFATVETAIEAMKQGAYDFIPKPFEPDHLRLVVGRAREKLQLTWNTEKLEQERRKTLFDLGTEKSRIRTIIESLPNGLVVTNAQGQVVLMNPTFLRQLELPADFLPGTHIKNYIDDEGFCELVMDISQGTYTETDDIPAYEFSKDGKYFDVRGRPVLGEEKECLGAVITLVNITSLKMLDQLKSEFVAKVSHELRSPLSTIHEQLAVVLADIAKEEGSEKDQYLITRAKEKTQGLISLIGDLLDLSRIESGAMAREAKPVHLDELLKSIVEFLNARAKAKKQSLSGKFPEISLPVIVADPVALESIFGNLIANAINYTQEGGEITVFAELAQDNKICVKVTDNGFGIDPKYHEKIFERFYRVKNDKTRFITGTGLGLPIVKSLVDSLSGTIQLQSAVGEGTTFTVLLPLDRTED